MITVYYKHKSLAVDYRLHYAGVEVNGFTPAYLIDPMFFEKLGTEGTVTVPVHGATLEFVPHLIETVKEACYDNWHLPEEARFSIKFDPRDDTLTAEVGYSG